MQLGYLPRMQVRHTSEQAIGQVYVPGSNTILLVAVVADGARLPLVGRARRRLRHRGHRHDDRRYDPRLYLFPAGRRAGRLWQLIPLFTLFLAVDLSFFGANLLKIEEGGWFPLAIGVTACTSS